MQFSHLQAATHTHSASMHGHFSSQIEQLITLSSPLLNICLISSLFAIHIATTIIIAINGILFFILVSFLPHSTRPVTSLPARAGSCITLMSCSKTFSSCWIILFNFHIRISKIYFNNISFVILNIH